MPPTGRTKRSVKPLISISVVSHGDSAYLRMLLQTLARYEEPTRIQLLVTDNLGNDLDPVDPAPWNSLSTFRNNRPAGYAANHNAALSRAEGDYYCVVNPDVRFLQGVFSILVASIRAGEGAITAPLVVDAKGLVQDSFRPMPTPLELVQRRLLRSASVPSVPPGAKVLRTDWLAGIFMFMHRDTFALLDGFDERYRLYFEDVDFCTRARLSGLASIVNTGVRIQHDARRSSRSHGKYLLWHLQSSLRFFTSPAYRQARETTRQHEATL